MIFPFASRIALMVGLAVGTAATAQEAAPPEPADKNRGSDIIVTGTRTTGFKASDSPAPIQVLGSDMLKRTGQQDAIAALAQNLPSVQAQAFGSDQAALHPMFKLRGLSPNDTLILVNGKRRHGNANVVVSGGPYNGAASADVALIPTSSIDHIEVLQDGAAAQYGTDAIAGVINIIQKKTDHGGSLTGTIGQYMDQGGKSYDVQGDIGITPFENAWLNLSGERKHSGFSFRGDIDPRISGTDAGSALVGQFPGIATGTDYPYVNRIEGDPLIDLTTGTYNAGVDIGDVQVYSFGSYGHRTASAFENYRTPTTVTGRNATDVFYPQGFRPQEHTVETDYAATLGVSGEVMDTTFDISTTYGKDKNDIYVRHSANAALYYDTSTLTTPGQTPTTFYDGTFFGTQWTNTIDLTHKFDLGLAEPLTVAGGLEYRRETYGIEAGDPASYYTGTSGVKGGGAQSFFGYSPNNAGSYNRHDVSEYLDLSLKPIEAWLIDAAVRHEDYSDFGTTTVFKVTSRYDFSDMIAVRGTVSTGFRAPTLAEEFYSGINVGPQSISGVFAPNSPGASFLGVSGLKPEKSTNFSGGFVFKPMPRLTLTVDGFYIKLRHRIVQSSTFYGYNGNATVVTSPSVLQALAANGVTIDPSILASAAGTVGVQTFVNGADTRTAGVDVTASYASDLGDLGHVDWSLAGNFTDTKITKIYSPPSNVDQGLQLLDANAQSNLVNASPKWRIVASAYWTLGKFTVNLRESLYGKSFTYNQDPTLPQFDKFLVKTAAITDLEIGYQVLKNVKLTGGANNLLNQYPTKVPAAYRASQLATGSSSYASSVYPGTSPYGINGGYYYGRVTFNW